MKIKDIIPFCEQPATITYAEDFDNVGLLVG
jgi:putative NIF3 family GTP cyclohydrolase 1 type 2